jgi:hypothetical protein
VSANLLFLATRFKNYRPALERRYRIVRKEGDLFQLVHRGSTRQEVYKVVSIAEDSVVVQLMQGRGGSMGGAEGGMMPGAEMGPGGGGMMPGMGPAEGGGDMMGGGMTTPLGPGAGGAAGVVGQEPEPIQFTITKAYDPDKDLIDMPTRRPTTPGTMPGSNVRPGMRR